MITSASARSPIRIRCSGASATVASTSYQGSGGKSRLGQRLLQALGDRGVGAGEGAPGLAVGVWAGAAPSRDAVAAAVACSLIVSHDRR